MCLYSQWYFTLPYLKHLKNNFSTKISLLLTLAPGNYPKILSYALFNS